MTLVSVIIPAYNAESTISETIQSVLSQTHTELELLVVDDGSTDQTQSVVNTFCESDSRVSLITQKNGGVAAARNMALTQVKGDFVALLDADDLWHCSKLQKQLKVFSKGTQELGLVYSWTALINEDSEWNGGYITFSFEGDVQAAIAYLNFIGHASSPLIRTSVLKKIGGFDEELRLLNAQGCEDWDLYFRIAQHYQFSLVPELLVGYRQTASAMSTNIEPMMKSYELVQERYLSSDLPKQVYRWSRALLTLHFSTIKTGKQYRRLVLSLLCQALWSDWSMAVNLQFYRVLNRTLSPVFIQKAIKVFNSWIPSDYDKSPGITSQAVHFSEIDSVNLRPLSEKLFNRILIQRVHSLQARFVSNTVGKFASTVTS